MGLEDRKATQKAFSEDAQIMISTDAGGEGLNLQFCHVVINFDLGWRPMALEQRIGRVDRIGQKKVVKAINLVLEDSVEFRVFRKRKNAGWSFFCVASCTVEVFIFSFSFFVLYCKEKKEEKFF